MPTADTPSTVPVQRRRRWFQFSLRTVFVAFTLIATTLGLFIVPKAKRHAVVAHLKRLGCSIVYTDVPPDESWARRAFRQFVPRDWIDDVIVVDSRDAKIGDSDLLACAELSQLKGLILDRTEVTDAGLAHLANIELSQLKGLGLDMTQITDAGLVHLAKLVQLEVLSISGNDRITDAGVPHLVKLKELKLLFVDHTRVSYEGAAKLGQALEMCEIAGPPLVSDDADNSDSKNLPSGDPE